MTRYHEDRIAPATEQPSRKGMFAVDSENIEAFLALIGDKKLRLTRAGNVELVPAPTRSNALADEILRSMQPFLRHAYFGACMWPGKPACWPYVHDACGSWRLMTTARAETNCECGLPGKRRKLEVPWHDVNHHGRPKSPRYVAPKKSKR